MKRSWAWALTRLSRSAFERRVPGGVNISFGLSGRTLKGGRKLKVGLDPGLDPREKRRVTSSASERRMNVFTFVCLKKNEVSSTVDVQVLPEGAYRAHARNLLTEHASADAVEVWRDNEAIDRIERDTRQRD